MAKDRKVTSEEFPAAPPVKVRGVLRKANNGKLAGRRVRKVARRGLKKRINLDIAKLINEELDIAAQVMAPAPKPLEFYSAKGVAAVAEAIMTMTVDTDDPELDITPADEPAKDDDDRVVELLREGGRVVRIGRCGGFSSQGMSPRAASKLRALDREEALQEAA
jgi:hypothetical protein